MLTVNFTDNRGMLLLPDPIDHLMAGYLTQYSENVYSRGCPYVGIFLQDKHILSYKYSVSLADILH